MPLVAFNKEHSFIMEDIHQQYDQNTNDSAN